jgi:hypothetical protein
MKNLKIKLNSEAEAEEVKRLAVKAGYKLDALFGRKWSAEFCYLVLCENMSAGFANEIMADGDKPLSIRELREMVNPVREYLDKQEDGTYKLITASSGCVDRDWIEIPKGAEALTKEIVDSEEMLLWWRDNFNKCIGHDDHLSNHEIDVCNHLERNPKPEVLWQREQDEPFLTPECTLNDQYAEIERVRQAIKVKSGSDSNHALDAMSFGLMGAGATKKHNHYFKDVSNLDEIDVYMVLKLFNVTDPCLQHIAKKALCAGQRGHKDFKKDLQDILDTAKRAVEINNG